MLLNESHTPSMIRLANLLFRAGLFEIPLIRGVMDMLYDTYKRRESIPLFPSDTELNTYDVVIDVGAGLGFFTRWIHEHTPTSTKILSFEPDTLNFRILRRRVTGLNRNGGVEIHQKALSEKSGTVSLSRNLSHFGDHTVAPRGGASTLMGREQVHVPSTTLTDIVAALPTHATSLLIKLDVQGHEPFVLRGLAPQSLKDKRCDLLTEFSPAHLRAQGIEPQDFLAFLKERSDRCRVRNSDKTFSDLSTLNLEGNSYTDIWCENFKTF